jgi:hypothetical protein
MVRKLQLIFLLISLVFSTFAREGMWVPLLLGQNFDEMREMGFKLTIDDIYSVEQASMKDAIVLFGRGCTGELISPDGLLITNHHCGYSQIQSLSSLENDYLTDGFCAMNREQELPNPGLSVTFLVEMRDVTAEVFEGTDTLNNEAEIQKKIRDNIAVISTDATYDTHYEAVVKPFFEGNQYYLFINEKFTDVRLVGAPPSAIGKFGGDTDNWMWPRHTGDFALFRVYANADNQPADYSPDNVPYRPRKFFPINISGIEEGDFTMVFGYPGSTQQYLYSLAIEQVLEQRNPDRVAIRDAKLEIIKAAKEADRGTRIQYAAKYASASNAWKRWQGESRGLQRLDAYNVKKRNELDFANWVYEDAERKANYGAVLPVFDSLYTVLLPYQKAKDHFDEIVSRGTDSYQVYSRLARFLRCNTNRDIDNELHFLENHFKDYAQKVDHDVFVALFSIYLNEADQSFVPPTVLSQYLKRGNNKYLSDLYNRSVLNNAQALQKLVTNDDIDKLTSTLNKDPLFGFFDGFVSVYYDSIFPKFSEINNQIAANQKLYMKALLEKRTDEMLYPDANLTMRVTYGRVEGYQPSDGVNYKYYTTLDGIIEKDNPEVYDYNVPQRLKELYHEADYGAYAMANGKLPVCFIASNHTTGGNSGSPVINAHGHLIGMNFDRCWEGTMSDIMYDPSQCRNISVDMRYVLFLIERFAGAAYLLDEMEIIR